MCNLLTVMLWRPDGWLARTHMLKIALQISVVVGSGGGGGGGVLGARERA